MGIEHTTEDIPSVSPEEPELHAYTPVHLSEEQLQAMRADEIKSANEAEEMLSYAPIQKYHVGNVLTGTASFYGPGDYGKPTSSGRILRPGQLIAAHRGLPNGTFVQVTNLDNPTKSVIVEIIDNGPAVLSREIDLSEAAFDRIGDRKKGLCRTSIKVVSLPQAYVNNYKKPRTV